MALDLLNNSNLEHLALKGLIVLFAYFASLVLNGHFSWCKSFCIHSRHIIYHTRVNIWHLLFFPVKIGNAVTCYVANRSFVAQNSNSFSIPKSRESGIWTQTIPRSRIEKRGRNLGIRDQWLETLHWHYGK